MKIKVKYNDYGTHNYSFELGTGTEIPQAQYDWLVEVIESYNQSQKYLARLFLEQKRASE